MARVAFAPARACLAVSALAIVAASGNALAQQPPVAPSYPVAEESAPGPDPSAVPAPPPPPPPPAAPPPQPPGAWSGGYPHAPPERPPPGPPPKLDGPQYGRRPVELVPALQFLLPQCSAGEQSSDRCEGVFFGIGLEFSALWRMSPHFAWGGALGLAGFGYTPPGRLELRDASAGGAFISLLARVYFVDEGAFDPYLEAGVGGGFMGTAGREVDDVSYENTGAGLALRVGGGLDFHLSRSLRLGPSLVWTRLFVDKIRRCETGGGDCLDLPKEDHGHLAGHVALGAKLTIMIGDEM